MFLKVSALDLGALCGRPEVYSAFAEMVDIQNDAQRMADAILQRVAGLLGQLADHGYGAAAAIAE